LTNPSGPKLRRRAPLLGAGLVMLCLAWLWAYGTGATQAGREPRLSPSATPAYAAFLPVVFRPQPTLTTVQRYLPALQRADPPTPTPTPAATLTPMPTPTATCPASSTLSWGQMPPARKCIVGAEESPDLNLAVRGWYPVNERLGFVRYGYPTDEPPDTQHPLRLSWVAGSTESSFVATYQVNDWDWQAGRPVPRNPIPYPVTMLGLRTWPGQPIHAAYRDLPIDRDQGLIALVMYADARQLTLKYTWQDCLDDGGYLVHIENFCVDPNLVALYQVLNENGRHQLPGVRADSVVGTAAGSEVDVVVRDSGSFLDPRSWQDWWQNQPMPAAWRK
jgi:hypothetical protein